MDNAAKIVGQEQAERARALCSCLGQQFLPSLLSRVAWACMNADSVPLDRKEVTESDLVDHPRFAIEAVTPGVVPPEGSVLYNASAVDAEPTGRINARSRNFN